MGSAFCKHRLMASLKTRYTRTWGLALAALSLSWLAVASSLQATEAREAWLAFFKEKAYPLESPADLAPLIDAAGDKRVVLLGESTHGTLEYYVWRDAISRRLVAEKDFRFIAVEGDWESLYALNRYVKGLPDAGEDARSVLLELNRWPLWMWANESIVEMAEWLRAYNAKLPEEKRVGFYGVDVYGWGDSVERLPDYLELLEPGWGDEVRPRLRELARMRGDMSRFQNAVAAGRPSHAEVLEEVIVKLREERPAFQHHNPKVHMKALQSAKLLRQAKRHMRYSALGRPDSWNPRAENFMDTVERLLDYYGEGAKGILWAHNTHVGDGRQTPMGGQGLVNSGQLARERLGAEHCFIVGFACYRGRVVAGRSWGSAAELMTMPDAREDSFDAVLHEAGLKQALILFETVREEAVFLQPGLQRAVGVVYRPAFDQRQNFVPTVLPLRYDALLYFDETKPLVPLHP